MRIKIVRVVKAELNESEFETMMVALERAGRYEDTPLSTKAARMREEFGEAILSTHDSDDPTPFD